MRIIFSEDSPPASADSRQSHLDDDIFPSDVLADALPPRDFSTSADALDTGITRPAFNTGSSPKLGPIRESYRGSPIKTCHTASGENATITEISTLMENAYLFIVNFSPAQKALV